MNRSWLEHTCWMALVLIYRSFGFDFIEFTFDIMAKRLMLDKSQVMASTTLKSCLSSSWEADNELHVALLAVVKTFPSKFFLKTPLLVPSLALFILGFESCSYSTKFSSAPPLGMICSNVISFENKVRQCYLLSLVF